MPITRRRAAAALFGLSLLSKVRAEPAAIPAERFFEPEQLNGAWLNPSGSQIALRIGGPGQRRRLVVLDVQTRQVTPVAAFKDDDVGPVHWVNDRRLIFSLWDERAAWDDHHFGLGLFAVDADGGNYRQLVARVWLGSKQEAEMRMLPWAYRPHWLPPRGDGQHILVARKRDDEDAYLQLRRLDTVSGRSEEIELPPRCHQFWADASGEPRAAYTAQGSRAQLHWRDAQGWRLVDETERYFGDAPQLRWQGADGQVYALSRRGRDTQALFRYDTSKHQLADKPLLGLAQFDLDPEFLHHEGRLLGLRVSADARTTVWLDAEAKALQQRVDALLPATGNLLQLPSRGDSDKVLVHAFSDRRAGDWYLFDRAGGQLTLLGRARPAIDPAQMSAMDFRPYAARDGRTIPAYLTLPRSAGERRPLPLVVLVHGGPFVRGGDWRWDAEVQFLASRGYAVLQPDFRGSDGYGAAHLQAGFKQWGLAMQDDLADGARWAIAQGIADPQRIAIMGASYGGYAAMMGLVRDPELYRCAVNWVGVTDLELLYSAHWSDLPGAWKSHGLTTVIGDRKADAERIQATSPLQQAARITRPVLMAYGRNDQRVPIEHGERMRDALKGHNPGLEWVLYDKEGHGFLELSSKLDFYGRVERFLAKHLMAS